MPRTTTDYSKTIIYKIQSIDNPELLYVGSTVDFVKRKCAHKSDCGNPKKNHLKIYTMINQNGGWSMFSMIELYKFPCENKRQAECEEDRCIREMKTNMNMVRPYVPVEEQREQKKEQDKKYRTEHKEQIAEYQKHYREQNNEQLTEQKKKYYDENRELFAERRKRYYEENRELFAERSKRYYEENKEEVSERNKNYREQNPEKVVERSKRYYEENKEKLLEEKKQYRLLNKDKIEKTDKKYRILHKDDKAEYDRHYREQNKERIAEQNKEKVICECGCVSTKTHLARHKHTKKHQDLMKSLV